jgi:flagellar hook-length control protein FliK
VSLVASDLSFVQSHHQDRSARRPQAAEARPQPSPFATLLDQPEDAPPPSPHDRPERPQADTAAASTRDTRPDTGPRRGQENGRNRAERTDTQQPTSSPDGKTEGNAAADANAVDAAAANAAATEAKTGEAKTDDVGKDEKTAQGDGTDAALAAATDAAVAQQPAASVQVAVLAVPGTDLPAPKVDANAAEAAAAGGATIAPAGAAAAAAPAGAAGEADLTPGQINAGEANAGQTNADEAKGQTGRKGASGLNGAVPSTTPDAKPATSGKGRNSAAPLAAASGGPGEHEVQADANPEDKSAPARSHKNSAAGETTAPKPGETSPRPQVEAQAAIDKPTTDAGQLPPAQHRTESSLAPAAAAQSAAAPSDQVTVPVAGLAVEIAARLQAGSNRFSIRLDPPELGRIDVRLDVDRDGHVTSRLMVEKAETLDLLRRDAPQLERALQQAGLKTGDNGMQFSLRDQSFSGQNQNLADHPRSGAARLVIPDPEMTPVETVSSGYGRSLRLGTGIDIRV